MEHPSSHLTPDRITGQVSQVILWILLLLAATEFVVRGPVRYLQPNGWNDLSQYYAASRLWLRGQSFADAGKFAAVWRDEVGLTLDVNTARVHIAPPPGALVLFAPLGALSWPAAQLLWLTVVILSFAATVWALLAAAGLSFREPRGIAFIAGCLALAPFQTGVASGNQTILVVGLCAVGIWAAGADCDMIAGLFFGTACSLKPHIGAFLVLYYLWQRRWRLCVTAVALTVVLALLGLAWMQFAGVHWLSDYTGNVRFGAEKNTIDDFTSANPIRFMLINLQVPFYSFTHSASSANMLAFALGGVLILIWIALVLQDEHKANSLLSLGTIAVIGLLPLYHRFYDASVLAVALCWCLSRQNTIKNVGNTSLLLMAPFLVPGAAILQKAARRGNIPESWTHSWWWDRILMPHQTWLLLLLSLMLLYAMARSRRENAEPAG